MASVLVTGIGGPAGRAVARLLRERRHAVVGTDLRPISLPGIITYQVPAANNPAFVPTLKRIAAELRPHLVIPTVSEELPILAAERETWDHGVLAVSSYQSVFQANDKYYTCRELEQAQVPIPRYALPSELGCRADVAARLGWPCLSKPRVGRGGRGVRVYSAADWPPEPGLDDSALLQEFAPGTEYAPNLYLGRHGVTVSVLEKTRLREGMVGNAEAVVQVRAPDVAAVAFAACDALGLQGAVDVDVRRRADGIPVVLEVNARFGANLGHAPEVLNALLAEAGLH